MNSTESLNKAYEILKELMNEDCFDFSEVASSNFNERKNYLHDMIFEYFHGGETNLCGMMQNVDSDDYIYEGLGASPETIENINEFFKNEELIADIILLMDKDLYDEFTNEINER